MHRVHRTNACVLTVAMGQQDYHKQPIVAQEHHLDNGPGAGAYSSKEDWARENARAHPNDGRSPTRTFFRPIDAPGKYPDWQRERSEANKRSWATLAGWQDGVQSDISRGSQNWQADKERWVQTFGRRLGATTYHIEATIDALDRIDLAIYSARHIPVEHVILGILSLYIDRDIRDFDNRTLKRDGAKALLSDLDCTVGGFEQVRSLLRSEHSHILFND